MSSHDHSAGLLQLAELGQRLTRGFLEQLRLGTIKVRDILGEDAGMTDKKIEDSLWHYYYDIDKTVNYLLSD